MTVTREQLKHRLEVMEARRRQFEEQATRQGGKLRRHEHWRLDYARFPYLIGAPDDRLAARFKDILFNQAELTPESKIGILPVGEENSFMEKFTHLLEEYGARTGGSPPADVIRAARAPILKYFENGEPIGSKLFRAFSAPSRPFAVKYGRREFLEPMLCLGRLRISPASYYNETSHNSAVKDDEIHRTFFIPTFRERLNGLDHIMFQGHRLEFGDDDIVLPVEAPDYFLLSLSESIYHRLPTDFEANAALVIYEPNRFVQRVISAFLGRYPEWRPNFGPVTYYDPYRDYNKVRFHQMSKHFGYAYQRELRIVIEPMRSPRGDLQPEFLNIGPMNEYAELLSM